MRSNCDKETASLYQRLKPAALLSLPPFLTPSLSCFLISLSLTRRTVSHK